MGVRGSWWGERESANPTLARQYPKLNHLGEQMLILNIGNLYKNLFGEVENTLHVTVSGEKV